MRFPIHLMTMLWVAAALSCSPVFAAALDQAERLALPYPARPAIEYPETGTPFVCPEFSQPPHDLVFTPAYKAGDPEHDEIDFEAQEQYRGETRPIVHFENTLLALSNRYFTGNRKKEHLRAQCVLEGLDVWASADAMLGQTNHGGVVIRLWTLASLSSAYGQIRDEDGLDPLKKEKVAQWLLKVASAVMADYPPDSTAPRHHNNLLYWAAWSIAMTGIAIDDKSLYDWGISRGINAVLNINPDGTLPLELKRGKRSLIYHQFALMPLIMLAEAGLYNGIDLYSIREGLLARLARRVLLGLDEPEYFARKTGFRQEGYDNLMSGHRAWMEVYHTRFPNARARKWILQDRPMISRRMGGNMTLLYGRKNP